MKYILRILVFPFLVGMLAFTFAVMLAELFDAETEELR